jgi:lysophospholipid acyltransferase
MSFTVAPFIILYFGPTIAIWSRVYFYGIVAVGGAMAFFASPAKTYLISRLKKRNGRPQLSRVASHDSHPVLGLPSDPEGEFDQAVREITAEIEARRRRGSKATMPRGQELIAAVEDKLGKKLK